ncbi:energy transducer TonB [Novosphingobium sp. BL-8H]
MTTGADLRPPRSIRWGMAALVTLLHLLIIAVLVQAFAPTFADELVRTTTQAFDIPLSPPPSPQPEARQSAAVPAQPGAQGSAGAPGQRALPREVAAPRAPVAIVPTQAPPVVGSGRDDAAGAGQAGTGSGAGGQGAGPGAGGSGSGQGGGGAASRPEKIAGDINSARDYPAASRQLRLGHQVVVILRVGVDGKAKSCRIAQPSPDAEADRITCALAMDRFRFRPARDAAGNPVEADYGWRQRWFLKAQGEMP